MKSKAFTLAELLISLAILGVIATFTIPKVLTANQNSTYNAIAKESMATVSAAYDAFKKDNGTPPTTMTAKDLIPYLNYVKVSSSSTDSVDASYGGTTWPCTSSEPCVYLHNGSALFMRYPNFAGTSNLNRISFVFDPDGKVTDATTNGPGKSVSFSLYYNGKLTDVGNLTPNTVDSAGTTNPDPTRVPPWFTWN